ncbi:MAG TPA: ABC transporter permease [Steroidobacteraceae bacterium]
MPLSRPHKELSPDDKDRGRPLSTLRGGRHATSVRQTTLFCWNCASFLSRSRRTFGTLLPRPGAAEVHGCGIGVGGTMTAANSEHVTADGVRIELKGRITAYTAAPIWRSALDTLARNPDRPIIVEASQIEYADDVGIALLFDLIRRDRPVNAKVEIRDLAPNLGVLVDAHDPKDFVTPPRGRTHPGIFEEVGRATAQQLAYVTQVAEFVGDCWVELRQAFTRRGRINWGDVLDIATEAGANAVPVVLLVGFLMGVIIAFESAVLAQQFGAVLFVVNGVGFALLRELSPLMTAIVFAGRSGAAFAAQIGTQKVNEEVNAITTFGLSPIQFLVLPRLVASILVAPLLTVLAGVVGLFGAALVMLKFDIGFLQFYHQLIGAVTWRDFMLGIVKAVVFGLTIAVVGCQRGLATGAGATSVGLSTTSAVVTSLVLIIVIDGIFSVFTI